MKLTRVEKFLYNRGLLEKFKYNFDRYSYETYEWFLGRYSESTTVIYMAFQWDETPEGDDVWRDIHNEWKENYHRLLL